MANPLWNDPGLKAGTMARSGLWLLQEVGLGKVFTKERHRLAFPGIAQADRRLRDLRAYGWTIYSSADDASLNSDEQRFVAAGESVWDPASRSKNAGKAITAKERASAFAADGYQCVLCGIRGGEDYLDSTGESAVLVATRRSVSMPGSHTEVQLVTECRRCRAGRLEMPTDVTKLLREFEELSADERARMKRWVARGRKGGTPLDRVWIAYIQLPHVAREYLASRID